MKNFKLAMAVLFFTAVWVSAGTCADYSSEPSKFVYSEYSKKISMDFKDAALGDILKIFSQQSGMNFIAASDINNKKVTLFFENIPVEEALDKILTANNLMYEAQPGSSIFIVKTLVEQGQTLVTRVYPLKYASVPSSKINNTIAIESSSSSSSSSSTSGSSSSSSSSDGSSSSLSSGIVAAISGVLSSKGKLIEDPRTNSLIITDVESQFATIESTIARLDVSVPQILIEVEMLDVSKGTADKIGIKYSDTVLSLTGAKRATFYPWDLKLLKAKGLSLATDDEYTAGSLDTSSMKMLVQFLETQTDTRNLARPRVITLNNETAQIKITTNEAIGLNTSTQSTGGSTGETTLEAERVETGVSMLVTPQANLATGEITMAIVPKVIQARDGATFNGKTFKDAEERGSQQLMKIKNGETIVIGGLLRTDESQTVTKLPLLGDLPLIGRAFRHKDKVKSERELLIFITPSIIDENNKEKLLTNRGMDLTREQEVPKTRSKQINKELTTMEQQSY